MPLSGARYRSFTKALTDKQGYTSPYPITAWIITLSWTGWPFLL